MRREATGIADVSKAGDEALLFGRRYRFVNEIRHAGGGDLLRPPVVICDRIVDNAENDLNASMPWASRHEYVMESEWLDGRRKLLEKQQQQEQFHSQSIIDAQLAASDQSAAGVAQPPTDVVGAVDTRSAASVSPHSAEEQSITWKEEPVEESSVDFSSITAQSPASQKLALFRSLFHGREDVFARKWVNAKKRTKGFSPACANKWKPGLCLLKQRGSGGCGACRNRQFEVLTDRALLDHFTRTWDSLNNIIGIYPMDEHNETWFLAIDFDKGEWQREVACVRQICAEREVPCTVERSQSGNGAHLWIFFDERISGATARRFGETLLTLGMEKGGVRRFSTYDRLFPNQDTIASGGFGNLIALPLQKQARDRGNSVFVDEEFKAYEDQWAFLSTVCKVSIAKVRENASLRGRATVGELAGDGEAVSNQTSQNATEDGGLAKNNGRTAESDSSPMPSSIVITRSNMLQVPKAGLSASLVNSIRRLAAFSNPAFIRAQAMRQTVWGKPRIVNLGEETDDLLLLPRGCEDALIAVLSKHSVTSQFKDERTAGNRIKVSFKGRLRSRQRQAMEAMLHHDNGVLVAPTGFGKTVIAAAMIAKRKTSTLIVVRSSALLQQWREALSSLLNIRESVPIKLTKTGKRAKHQPSVVGQIGDGREEPSGIIDIALAQSLLEKGEAGGRTVKALVQRYGMVIFDECHHVAASGHEAIARAVGAKYVYGLTGTPRREDGLHPITFMQCGPIRHTVEVSEQMAGQSFKRQLIPRFTAFHADLGSSATLQDYVSELCASETRNRMIVGDIKDCCEAGRSPLVLAKRVEHAKRLAAMLKQQDVGQVELLTGQTAHAAERKETLGKLKNVPEEKPLVVVATLGYVGEGFDLPRLDTLFLVSPVSWEGPVSQAVGRLHRDAEGKHEVLVYDYADVSVPMLERMYRKRLKAYAKLGYEFARGASSRPMPGSTPDERRLPMMVFADGYAELLRDDINACQRSLVIATSAVGLKSLKVFEEALSSALGRGVSVSVFVQIREEASEAVRQRVESVCARIVRLGCSVRQVAWCPDIAVFDDRLAWYGSLPLLGFGVRNADDCAMRAVDRDMSKLLISNLRQGTRPLLG